MNEYISAERANRFKAAQIKRETQNDIGVIIRHEKALKRLSRHEMPCTLEIHWVEENNRRDLDNISFATKFIQDALVENGIFPDDSRKYITELHHTCETKKGESRVIVTIKEND